MTPPTSPTRRTAARRSAADRPTPSAERPWAARSGTAAPVRLRVALGLALAAAVAAAVAPAVGVLQHAPPPGFAAGPLLAVLAALPVAVAFGLVIGDHAVAGARVLVGAAVLAPGALLLDLQLMVDVNRVARPELVMPASLATLAPATGGWLLLGAHLLTMAAGVAAAGLAGATTGSAYAEEVENPDSVRDLRVTRRLLGLSLGCGVLVAVGLLMPALYSHDALLVAVDVVPNPGLVRAGLLALAIPAVAALAWSAATGNPTVHRGTATGVLLAITAITVPSLAAGLAMDRVSVAPGPILALVGAVLAVGVALLPAPDSSTDSATGSALDPAGPAAGVLATAFPGPTTGGPADSAATAGVAGAGYDVPVPAPEVELTLRAHRLHQVAGLVGVLVGAALVWSSFVTVFTVRSLTGPGSVITDDLVGRPTKLGVAAGLLVAMLGLLTATAGAVGSAVRPAFLASLGVVPLLVTTVFSGVLDATTLRDSLQGAQFLPGGGEQVTPGGAFWLSLAAIVGAAVAGLLAALAGGAERDELELTERPDNAILLAPVVAAGLFAIGAFGLPVTTAPGRDAAGIWSNFQVTSVGLLLALLVVLGAVLLAPRARPARGAGLLLGAAGVLGVHLLELPLGPAGTTAGTGWWLSLVTAALLLVAAVVAGTAKPHPARTTRTMRAVG